MSRNYRVFVTDGSYANGLAAVRSLSSAGLRVTVGERTGFSLPRTIAFWSRHCSERFRYPDPNLGTEACAEALAAHFRSLSYDAIIPVGLDMVELFLRYKDSLSIPVMLPSASSFWVALDKRRTFQHAAALGIPIPRTLPAARWRELSCPLVFKHPRTGAVIAHTPHGAEIRAAELGATLDEHIVQEYIPGENGFGYFGFFQEGVERGYFMHERLMQFPREGGPSVVARAIRHPRVRELGRKLLESLGWHGVAMVEFKRSDLDGEFYLMEINPKLWGSLDLAIQSGCDFPVWIARFLIDGSLPHSPAYREGFTYQWVVPNGLKCYLRYPDYRTSFLRNLASPRIGTELRCLDPLPTVAGLIAMCAKVVQR